MTYKVSNKKSDRLTPGKTARDAKNGKPGRNLANVGARGDWERLKSGRTSANFPYHTLGGKGNSSRPYKMIAGKGRTQGW